MDRGESFAGLEAVILRNASLMLDTLLDSAALARPGVDAERHSAELRGLAGELGSLIVAVEALTAEPQFEQRAYRSA